MPSLAETQTGFRRAIGSDIADIGGLGIVAPSEPGERLAIYRRHFRESFRRHLRGRFPTVEWLIGTPRMIELADAVVGAHPPRAPSLAEYGKELAIALSGELAAGLPPYLASVALMDWHLGNAAVATSANALSISDLATVPPDALGDTRLTLHQGTTYFASDWPVDILLGLRLSGDAPDRLRFDPEAVSLELRGARGNFSFQRLNAGTTAFRSALLVGGTLGAAAELGLAGDPAFEISTALARLFADGLVGTIHPPLPETSDA